MKNIYLILSITFTTLVLPESSHSGDILNTIKNKANQGADTKTGNAIHKEPGEAEGKNKPRVRTGAAEVKQKRNTGGLTQNDTVPGANAATQLSYTSKYDFVPGDKIIAYEDFNSANVGDFPVRW